MLTQKQNMINISSVKNWGTIENFGTDIQVLVFGHMLSIVDGDFQKFIFVTCV
jgi:hypothetical protein